MEAAKPQVPVPGSGRSMTFQFKMHEFKLNMLKSRGQVGQDDDEEDDGQDDKENDEQGAFAMLLFTGFVVSYENGNISTLDMHMDGLSIADLIHDLIQDCLFATSDTGEGGGSSSDSDGGGASKGSFVSIQRGWAVPGAANYPGFETWWEFNFRTLALNWNDKTVSLLMQFCGAAFATHSKALATAAAAHTRSQGTLHNGAPGDSSGVD